VTDSTFRRRAGRPGAALSAWRSAHLPATDEKTLSEFYADYVTSGAGSFAYLLGHPVATIATVIAIGRLPIRQAVLPRTLSGRTIHSTLTRPGPLRTPFGVTGVAVLDVPADAAEYSLGAERQTLRRKVRAATKSGVTWRPVDDQAERRALLALANKAETEHADEEYRNAAPDNSDLLDHDLWLAAFAADGRPLLLSVTPTAGEWGQLRYFRTLGSGHEYSDCRYLMTQALVETLSGRGVRHLMEGTHPAELPNGLRHFQRMVGFRLARVVARLEPEAAPEPEPRALPMPRRGETPYREVGRRVPFAAR
jgi:hypothetical protein